MKNKTKYVAIVDIAHDLGILEEDFDHWLTLKKVETNKDHRGRKSVDVNLKHEFAESPEYFKLLKRSIFFDCVGWQESRLHSAYFKKERLRLIDGYRQYIAELRELHISIKPRVNFHEEESAVRAAYLLFSKAISCLEMGCDNIASGYWVAGSIMREIDETIDLARYFMVMENKDIGKGCLQKWFRQNHAPKHSECREALSLHIADKNIGVDGDSHKATLNELYNIKSKWVHPTFGIIREVTEFNISNGLDIVRCTLGASNHELKLFELADFYRSSIWSTFQAFMSCFSGALPLGGEEIDRLLSIDREFQEWE